MPRHTRKYYIKGIESNRADFTIDMQRPDKHKLEAMSQQDKKHLRHWLMESKSAFTAYWKTIYDAVK